MSRNLLLLSTTTIHGSRFLEYCLPTVKEHFENLNEILFVPYARPSGISYDEYTALVRDKLKEINLSVTGVHELTDIKTQIKQFKGIYIGGGNTFLLLKELYNQDLMDIIRQRVLDGEMRYMGSSAGTNVACMAINNTNDMPIVYPPSFEALALVPFNINPHFLDPDPKSTHRGETRETRINEFHHVSSIPVVGLREGSWLSVKGDAIKLGGTLTARMFQKGKDPVEMGTKDDFSFLLSQPK